MRTFTQSLSPGLPKRCSESRVGRTTFAQTMHLANACRFNSSSTLLQQASHCESTSYVLSIRTFRLTLLVPLLLSTPLVRASFQAVGITDVKASVGRG